MDYQTAKKPNSLPSLSRAHAIERLGPDENPEYWAWPETFGSTTGPFRGIGGSAMTTFTMEAWVGSEHVLVFCGGREVRLMPVRKFFEERWHPGRDQEEA